MYVVNEYCTINRQDDVILKLHDINDYSGISSVYKYETTETINSNCNRQSVQEINKNVFTQFITCKKIKT